MALDKRNGHPSAHIDIPGWGMAEIDAEFVGSWEAPVTSTRQRYRTVEAKRLNLSCSIGHLIGFFPFVFVLAIIFLVIVS